jgi:hypothetical protein
MNKNRIKIIIGGPLGIFAWSISAGTILIVFIWGLEKSAIALVAAKTVSWGIWGIGVIRHQLSRSDSLKEQRGKTKLVKKSPFLFSWRLTFYLYSIGERKQLNCNPLSTSLTLYHEYYVSGKHYSSLAYVYSPLSEKRITHLHIIDSLQMRQSLELVSAPQCLKVRLLDLEFYPESVSSPLSALERSLNTRTSVKED